MRDQRSAKLQKEFAIFPFQDLTSRFDRPRAGHGSRRTRVALCQGPGAALLRPGAGTGAGGRGGEGGGDLAGDIPGWGERPPGGSYSEAALEGFGARARKWLLRAN